MNSDAAYSAKTILTLFYKHAKIW